FEENHDLTDGGRSVTGWGAAPYIGITDQLELQLPVEFEWFGKTGAGAGTAFTTYGGELRYRMVTNDAENRPPFAPLVRVGAHRIIRTRDVAELNVGLSGSYESGIVHALADVNFIGDVDFNDRDTDPDDGSEFAIRAGAGVSVEVYDDIRLGAELFAHVGLGDAAMGEEKMWIIAGPGGSWTHGRFWLSAMYGIGVANIGTAPRVQWGIAF
ncbi:MAG TPA: hypothetical protein VMZ53_12940, partial [Kofleriaceae bacterium]|nr:hypothetical protein [Kofleriaceae bacterium]